MIEYKPWSGQISDARDKLPESNDTYYIEVYSRVLHTPAAATCTPQFAQEFDQAAQHMQEVENGDSETEEPTQPEQHEDWMLLCHLNQQYNQETI